MFIFENVQMRKKFKLKNVQILKCVRVKKYLDLKIIQNKNVPKERSFFDFTNFLTIKENPDFFSYEKY